MSKKIGICIIGSNGAVATTVMAGVELMKRGLSPKLGMATEGRLGQILDFADFDEMVFGGWDLRSDDGYEAAKSHGVVDRYLLEQVKEPLSQFKPWPAAVSKKFLSELNGSNVVSANGHRDEVAQIQANIENFKKEHGLDRVVMVNLTSTERFTELSDVHMSISAFEKGLDENHEQISPAMKYLYAACKLGVPHANFTPSLSKIPALEALAEETGTPIAGEDGKTGQTLMKTILAPGFSVRQLRVDGWYSCNILGNNDGLILNDPESNKTKVTSKQKPLDSIMGYKVDNHQVHIHYYKPRGDAKEAWDNIDVSGFLGETMQIKMDFLCKDSILAAPLVIDMVRLLDVAKQRGEKGIQRQLSLFFKAPYHTEGEEAEHDLFKQNSMLNAWAEDVSGQKIEDVSYRGATQENVNAATL